MKLLIYSYRVTECSKEFHPVFCSVSYHENPNKLSTEDNLTLKFAADLHQKGLNVLLHLNCQGQTKKNVYHILKEVEKIGVKNIFALKGGMQK